MVGSAHRRRLLGPAGPVVMAEKAAAIAKKAESNHHDQAAENEENGTIARIIRHLGLLDRDPGKLRRDRRMSPHH
jgi:hypothetical protein